MAHKLRLLVFGVCVLASLVSAFRLAVQQAVRQQRLNAALIAAVKHNDLHRVRRLLEQGADANARDATAGRVSLRLLWHDWLNNRSASSFRPGSTALMLAAEWRYPCFPDSSYPLPLSDDSNQIITALLAHGADVNRSSIDEQSRLSSTPLVDAAWVGNRKAVRLLVLAGADVNAANGYGMTALYWSAMQNDVEGVRLLLSRHADVNRCDNQGRTPLYWVHHQPMLGILKQAGAR